MSDPIDDRLYGRRHGRKLRLSQKRLLEETLPRVRLSLPDAGQLDPLTLFPHSPARVWLEIGFGGGEHMAWQAIHHPDVGVIGCEPFLNGVVQALGHIATQEIETIRVWPNDVRPVLDLLPDASIDRAFILFPDPWPKRRHQRRRIVQKINLDRLARVMRPGSELRMATDDADYMAWMLFETVNHPQFEWTARRSADWRERPADWPETRYERKARSRGLSPWFLRFVRR